MSSESDSCENIVPTVTNLLDIKLPRVKSLTSHASLYVIAANFLLTLLCQQLDNEMNQEIYRES